MLETRGCNAVSFTDLTKAHRVGDCSFAGGPHLLLSPPKGDFEVECPALG